MDGNSRFPPHSLQRIQTKTGRPIPLVLACRSNYLNQKTANRNSQMLLAIRSLSRLEVKLLAADRSFEHQSAFWLGEDGDSVLKSRCRRCTSLERNRRSIGREFELVVLESIQGIFILEDDYFGISLSTGLETDRCLREIRISDHP